MVANNIISISVFTTNNTMLDVIMKHVSFHVSKVLPFGVLLLEGRDSQKWKDHVRDCVSCHFPDVNGQIDSSLVVVPIKFHCMLCGQSTRIATMQICDKSSKGWHMRCFIPPLEEVFLGKWFCLQCTSQSLVFIFVVRQQEVSSFSR